MSDVKRYLNYDVTRSGEVKKIELAKTERKAKKLVLRTFGLFWFSNGARYDYFLSFNIKITI